MRRSPSDSIGTGRPAFRSPTTAVRKSGVRERAARATREALLRAATRLFAKHGMNGTSVDMIAKAAKTNERMIYYYFGSKEGLFVAVLETSYQRFNDAEAALDLDPAIPVAALLSLTRFVMSYYRKHPEFVSLLNLENLQRGKHVNKSRQAGEYSLHAISVFATVLESGIDQGLFSSDIRARDLYLLIASTGYFYQSNRYTLSAFLGENLDDPATIAHWESFVEQTVLRTVCIPVSGTPRKASKASTPGAPTAARRRRQQLS